jgi:hypothetical protein
VRTTGDRSRTAARDRAWLGGRALGLVFVVVVGVGGLLAIVGWAGLIRAAEEGDFSLLQAYTLIPLALWCVLVWYLLRRFRFTRG